MVVRHGDRRHWLGGILGDEVEDLARWLGDMGDQPPVPLRAHVFDGLTGRAKQRLIPARGPDLAALCAELCTAGTWTMGVPGAIAEFDSSAETADVRVAETVEGTIVTATTSTGAMRVCIDGATRAFGFGTDAAAEEPRTTVLVRTGDGLTPRRGLTEVGRDPDPIVEDDRGAVLFDLGLDRAATRFMVRVADGPLVALLRRARGTPIEGLETAIWQAMVEASPTRVVETVIGRVEVSAPIPPPQGRSPVGSHTHLLPDILDLGLDLPAGLTVPSGWRIGPIHYADHADDHDV